MEQNYRAIKDGKKCEALYQSRRRRELANYANWQSVENEKYTQNPAGGEIKQLPVR